MRTTLFTIIGVMLAISATAQQFSSDNPNYKPLVVAGEAALAAMKYDSCMIYYKQAFEIKQTSYLSTMRNAACAYSADDKDYLAEQLKIAFDLSWGGSKSIYDNYPEFEYLKDSEFEKMVNDMYLQYAEESGVDLAMMEEFETIRYEDQRYRQEMRGVEEKYGWESPQMDSLWVLQNAADSVNTLRICEVIDEKGYPGRSLVGDSHASTAFLVIQHADLEIQEKYLPIITKAADDGEVRWSSVALLVDRVNMRNGKPQIYGSQVSRHPETEEFYFSEIAEPLKIDSIRATVGLGPLQSYADNWDFKWDPERNAELVKEVKAIKAKEEAEKEKEDK